MTTKIHSSEHNRRPKWLNLYDTSVVFMGMLCEQGMLALHGGVIFYHVGQSTVSKVL